MGRSKELVLNTIFMFIGTFGTKFISFFMVPVYTYCLSTAEYGVADLAFTVSMLLTPVVALNIHESIMRFALDDDADVEGITSTGVFVFVLGAVVSLVLIPIFLQIEMVAPYAVEIYLLINSTAFLYLVQSYMKGTDQVKLFSLCGVLVTFLTASSNIVLLVVFSQGIFGYLLSTVISYLSVAIFALFKSGMIGAISLRKVNKSQLRPMLSYSAVLVPNSLMWWVVNSSNRLIISLFIGPAANGIFAVSNKLPTLLNSVTSVFQQAWQLTAIKSDGDNDKSEYATRVFAIYSCVIWIASSAIVLLIKPFMDFLIEDSYYDAWIYTPILIVAFAFLSFASYVGTYYSVSKNNKGMVASAFVGLLVNTTINFLLIPTIGLQGASIAACAAYFSIFIYRYRDTRKYVAIKIFNKRFVASCLFVCVQCCVCIADFEHEWALELLMIFCVLAANWSIEKSVCGGIACLAKERFSRG